MSRNYFMLRIAAALSAAIGAAVIASLAPVGWFAFFRLQVVGSDQPLDSTIAHRLIAVGGAMLAGVAVFRLFPSPGLPSSASPAPAPLTNDRRLLFSAIPFAALAAINIAVAILSLSLDGAARAPAPDALAIAFLAATAASGLAALAAIGPALFRESRRLGLREISLAVTAGAAYGCFSALWHCCPPLWFQGVFGAIALGGILVAASLLLLGWIAAIATRFPFPRGEIAGALLLAMTYPYHTPEWFLQCLAAGAFFTWLSRETKSLAAPGIALATAFLTHMTLPFVGWGGPAGAAALLAFAVFALVALRPAATASPAP